MNDKDEVYTSMNAQGQNKEPNSMKVSELEALDPEGLTRTETCKALMVHGLEQSNKQIEVEFTPPSTYGKSVTDSDKKKRPGSQDKTHVGKEERPEEGDNYVAVREYDGNASEQPSNHQESRAVLQVPSRPAGQFVGSTQSGFSDVALGSDGGARRPVMVPTDTAGISPEGRSRIYSKDKIDDDVILNNYQEMEFDDGCDEGNIDLGDDVQRSNLDLGNSGLAKSLKEGNANGNTRNSSPGKVGIQGDQTETYTAEEKDKVNNLDGVSAAKPPRAPGSADVGSVGVMTKTKSGKLNRKGSRGGLRVRSGSSGVGLGMIGSDSAVLDDPSIGFDYFYKIIIIGDELVGKTNLLLRISKGRFEKKPKTTYGVEFEFKMVPLPNSNQRVQAQIWDTSGAKQFLSITTTHYRFAVGAFLVYDVTNRQSFENLKEWLAKIREFSDDHVKIALVANKRDLVEGSDHKTATNFQNVINETEEDEKHTQSKRRPNKKGGKFRAESLQFEGGSPETSKQNSSKKPPVPFNVADNSRNGKGLSNSASNPGYIGKQNLMGSESGRSFGSKKSVSHHSSNSAGRLQEKKISKGRHNSASSGKLRNQKSSETPAKLYTQGVSYKKGQVKTDKEKVKQLEKELMTLNRQRSQKSEKEMGTIPSQDNFEGNNNIKYQHTNNDPVLDQLKPHQPREPTDKYSNAAQNSQVKSTSSKIKKTQVKLDESELLTLSQILGDKKPEPIKRQVTEEQGRKFAEDNGLIFLGETSCMDIRNNCKQIFKTLISEIHQQQTDLVKQGIKSIDDLRFGEEERHIKYDRCCY